MRKHLSLILALTVAFFCAQVRAAIVGSAPVAGTNYYLYSVYQAKFVGMGNAWGTQATLYPFGNANVLKFTLEDAGSGNFKINTHIDPQTLAWGESTDNWFYKAVWEDTKVPVVNANYYDNGVQTREATIFSMVEDLEGYYIIDTAGDTLKFEVKDMCTFDADGTTYGAEKSLWRFVTEDEYNTMLAKNRFTVAGMNVDGMPNSIKIMGVYDLSLNPDGKEAAGATAMGQKMVNLGYDFIAASEDFNFNDEIMAEIGGSYNQGTHRGKIETSLTAYTRIIGQTSPVFDTDGLNFFWKNTLSVSGESWTAWGQHYGYTDNEADGLIDKGYRFYVGTLSDGTEIDIYILHMEAGSSTGDIAARATQLTQLANAIIASNNGRPIVIIGDTNCRYTRDAVKSNFIDVINADERFTIKDVWVEHGRQGLYPTGTTSIMASEYGYRIGEVVDKVFYINNTASDIRLVSEAYKQDLSFVDGSNEPLADHWPCVADFSYHTYDPSIDDATDVGRLDDVYLRNVETGTFLKAGGWWGTHAVAGTYGSAMTLATLSNGKYVLQTPLGYLSQGDPYMDATKQSTWTLIHSGGHYIFSYDNNGKNMALTANDPTAFPYEPNVRYVTCAALNTSDTYQQWDIVTKDELMAEMLGASETDPYDCTFLLPGANFDNKDLYSKSTDNGGAWSCNISTSASMMSYDFSKGAVDFYLGNPVAEVNNQSYSGSTTYATTWEVSQTLTNLPNGRYKVTCQGFYRDGDLNANNPGTIHSYLYARTNSGATEEKVALASMYSANCSENLDSRLSSTDGSGHYVPNSMADASVFFSHGYYQNEVYIDVVGNTLTVAIGKPDVTKSTSGWTCFDNFQIQYLGFTPESNAEGYLYNLDAGAFLHSNANGVASGWGTRAVLDSSAGTSWTSVSADGGYRLLASGNSGVYLGATSTTEAWLDRTDDAETIFTLTADADNYYTIANVANSGSVMGWSGESSNMALNPLLSTADKELRGTRWAFMNATQYAQFLSDVSATHATRLSLWPAVRAIRNSSLSFDISSEETVWNSPAATASQLTAAVESMKEKQLAVIADATASAPADLTYYVQNADFGDNLNSWTNDGYAIQTAYYPTAASSNGPSLGYQFAERWVSSGNALPNSNIYQTLSGLPEGTYALSLNLRVNKWDDNTSSGLELYYQVGSDAEVVKTCDVETGQNYCVQTDAFQVAADSDLKVGFRVNGTTNINWVAFDNFRLLYLGPAHSYNYVEYSDHLTDNVLYLYGTWRESEQSEFEGLIGEDITAVVLTGATIPSGQKLTVPTTAQPNIVIYTGSSTNVSNTKNVVVSDICNNLCLTDKEAFSVPNGFTATSVTYKRENTGGYNTVCMPFEIDYDDIEDFFGVGTKVYTFTSVNTDGSLPLICFTELTEGSVSAGEPCLISSSATTWNSAESALTPAASSLTVACDAIDNSALGDAAYLQGVFQGHTLGEGFYKLNSAGTYFVLSTAGSTIKPFRFYVKPAVVSGVKQIGFAIVDADGIREVTNQVDTDWTDEPMYDLSGRRVSKSNLKRGIYIQGDRKVLR